MRAVAALFAALSEPVLHGPRVADLLAGNAGDHHDLLLGEFRKPLHQHRKHNRAQIRPAGQDLAGTALELALGPGWQGEQVEQRVKIGLTAELFQAQPAHLLLQEQP